MKKNFWKALICLFIVILLILQFKKVDFPADLTEHKQDIPNYAVKNFPLPFLLYSNVTPNFILANRKRFQEDNFSGFIISSLPGNWNSPVEQLREFKSDCQKINLLFGPNFLRTSIAEKDLPRWEDHAAWVSLNARIKIVAHFAHAAGFQGLLIDTKAYNPMAWNPAYAYEQYNSISEELAKKVIYQRGRELLATIKNEFPEAEILITPAGLFAKGKKEAPYHPYYYWIHFLNGLLSESAETKFVLVADNVAGYTTAQEFSDFVTASSVIIKDSIDYSENWLKNNYLSLMSCPLGESEKNNYPKLSAKQFSKQLFLLQKYSQRYVVIYIPAATELPADYIAVLPTFRDPYLKAYYYQVQRNKKVAYLQFYLYHIFGILK